VISTLACDPATRRMRANTSCIARLRPMMFSKRTLRATSSRSRATSDRSACSDSALSITSTSCSISNGLVM
jgi:hypothetical protein